MPEQSEWFSLDWSGWTGFTTDASGAQSARYIGGPSGFRPVDVLPETLIEAYDFWAFTPDGELGYWSRVDVPIMFYDEVAVPKLTLN